MQPTNEHTAISPAQPKADAATPVRGRLAPSPTGHMHLGNAWSFLLAWLGVRGANGTLVLRMEDIDPDRSRQHFADDLMRDLAWLGLHWDEGPDNGGPHGPYVQSQRTQHYLAAIEHLAAAGHVYPCYCTRKELRQLAGAPHVGDAGASYPGTCSNLTPQQQQQKERAGRRPSLRLRCPQHTYTICDQILGEQQLSLSHAGGDFAIRRSDGVFAYQLAVVVDDGAMGITQVVRGNDILISTPRQLLLATYLGLPHPNYAHVPLLLDASGERLAKRHASLTIAQLRQEGIPASHITGFLGYLAGFIPQPQPASPEDLIPHFSWQKLPRTDIRLSQDPANQCRTLAAPHPG